MAKKKKSMPVQGLSSTKPVPVKIVNDTPSPSSDKDYEARERKYKAEDALRDIERAEKHKSDKALMSDVKKLAKDKVDSLKKFC